MKSGKVKFGLGVQSYPLDLTLDLAVQSEKMGFDSVWYFDDLEGFPQERVIFDPFSILSVIASKTKTVKVGIDVADTNRRHPVHLAQAAATIDVFSNGRMILGVGAGIDDERRIRLGFKSRSAEIMRENIEILKKLWTQREVDYHGRHFTLKKAIVYPKPVQKPHIPLWVAGNAPKSLLLTAEFGDGWVPMNCSPSILKEDGEHVKSTAKKIGRDPTKIETAYPVFVNIDEDYETAAQEILPLIRPTLIYSPQKLERLGYKKPARIEDIPDEAVEAFNLFGSAKECIKQVQRFIDAGVDTIILNFVPFMNVEKKIKMFREKVMPAFFHG